MPLEKGTGPCEPLCEPCRKRVEVKKWSNKAYKASHKKDLTLSRTDDELDQLALKHLEKFYESGDTRRVRYSYV